MFELAKQLAKIIVNLKIQEEAIASYCLMLATPMVTITKESCNWIEFISVAQCQMTPLKVWLYTALGCNHQSFACPSYSLYVQLLWMWSLSNFWTVGLLRFRRLILFSVHFRCRVDACNNLHGCYFGRLHGLSRLTNLGPETRTLKFAQIAKKLGH